VAKAVFAYNHASWYVTKVLAIASGYAASQGLPPGAPAEDVAAAAVQFAYSKLGHPYKWGATGQLGFYDCSGLMLQAYRAGGLELPRTSRQQWTFGPRVWNVGDLQPGDLVFYAYNLADPSTIHHVGIYIGAGNMIDAPYTGAFVRVTPFLRGDFIGAVRPTATTAWRRAPSGAVERVGVVGGGPLGPLDPAGGAALAGQVGDHPGPAGQPRCALSTVSSSTNERCPYPCSGRLDISRYIGHSPRACSSMFRHSWI
jgi:hypothetical protein